MQPKTQEQSVEEHCVVGVGGAEAPGCNRDVWNHKHFPVPTWPLTYGTIWFLEVENVLHVIQSQYSALKSVLEFHPLNKRCFVMLIEWNPLWVITLMTHWPWVGCSTPCMPGPRCEMGIKRWGAGSDFKAVIYRWWAIPPGGHRQHLLHISQTTFPPRSRCDHWSSQWRSNCEDELHRSHCRVWVLKFYHWDEPVSAWGCAAWNKLEFYAVSRASSLFLEGPSTCRTTMLVPLWKTVQFYAPLWGLSDCKPSQTCCHNLFRSQIAHFTWPSSATALYIQMQRSVKTLNSWHITFQFYFTSLLKVHSLFKRGCARRK